MTTPPADTPRTDADEQLHKRLVEISGSYSGYLWTPDSLDKKLWVKMWEQVESAIKADREQAVVEARIDGATAYNRVLTDELGKPTYMDDDGERHTVYKQEWVSAAIQKANDVTITSPLTAPSTAKGEKKE